MLFFRLVFAFLSICSFQAVKVHAPASYILLRRRQANMRVSHFSQPPRIGKQTRAHPPLTPPAARAQGIRFP